MTILWHPDTCECIIEVDNDWKSAKVIKACKFHADAKDWLAVRNENAYKNTVVGFVMEAHPDIEVTATYALGPLTVFVDLPANDKSTLQASLDDHFGAGEVAVGG